MKYFGMRLFFLTIPKPLKQYTLLKKMIHSALRGVGSTCRRLINRILQTKFPDPSYT